jgi:predicted RNase H-like HicB family nuclease
MLNCYDLKEVSKDGGLFVMAKLTLEYWEDDGWLVGRLVEVPGVFSQGETIAELKENIQDAYKMMSESESLDSFPSTRKRIVVEVSPRSGVSSSVS